MLCDHRRLQRPPVRAVCGKHVQCQNFGDPHRQPGSNAAAEVLRMDAQAHQEGSVKLPLQTHCASKLSC